METVESPNWIVSVKEIFGRHVQPGDKMLVAVSGGPDSMALLHLLVGELGVPKDDLVVGHVNHQMRANSGDDQEFVENQCRVLGVSMVAKTVDVLGRALSYHESLEAAARVLRYGALAEIAKEHCCKWTLTGHTLDDSAETVLMRLLNGSPWYECTGIPEQRGQILRPLLRVCRDDLRAELFQQNISYINDPSNEESKFLRNRIRLSLRDHEGYWTRERRRELAVTGQEVSELLTFMAMLLKIKPPGLYLERRKSKIGLAIDKIFEYYSKLPFLPIEASWAGLSGENRGRLSSQLRLRIAQCLTARTNQSRLELPQNITFLRRGNQVWLYKRRDVVSERRVGLGIWHVSGREGTIRIELSENVEKANRLSVAASATFADKKLVIRNWRDGDRIKLAKRGTKNVSDLLAELKWDAVKREETLVLADELGPIWIVGGPVAERALPELNAPQYLRIEWKEDDSVE